MSTWVEFLRACGLWAVRRRTEFYDLVMFRDLRRRERELEVTQFKIQVCLDVADAAARLLTDPHEQQAVVKTMIGAAAATALRDDQLEVATRKPAERVIRGGDTVTGATDPPKQLKRSRRPP
jgi:hypothetical protein